MGLPPNDVHELLLGDDLTPVLHHVFENAEGTRRQRDFIVSPHQDSVHTVESKGTETDFLHRWVKRHGGRCVLDHEKLSDRAPRSFLRFS